MVWSLLTQNISETNTILNNLTLPPQICFSLFNTSLSPYDEYRFFPLTYEVKLKTCDLKFVCHMHIFSFQSLYFSQQTLFREIGIIFIEILRPSELLGHSIINTSRIFGSYTTTKVNVRECEYYDDDHN